MKRFTGIILVILAIGLILPNVLANDNNVVITYGETTYNNQDYKNIVDIYFSKSCPIHEAEMECINADEVNKISTSISQKTYNSNQILSSALLDLNNQDLFVEVDNSKITTITQKMYESALKSAGIDKGQVIITSPVPATGESALAGIMECYENITQVSVPEEVKESANKEIYAEGEIIENSNITPETLSDLVDDVKEEAEEINANTSDEIVKIINNETTEKNIPLEEEDVDKLAEAIFDVHSVQDIAKEYETELSNSIENNTNSWIDNIYEFFGL